MSLQDRLDAFKADFLAGRPPYDRVPAGAHAIMARATAALLASGQAERAIGVGDVAPAFALQDQEGRSVRSEELLARGALVVSFYRGVWCPYCNLELQALNAALAQITAHGATLVAISPQTAVNSRRSVRDNRLEFPVLGDPGNQVAAAYGLRFTLPDELIALYRQLHNELPDFNGDASWTLPMPARYVIGQDGRVRYAEVSPDYTQRPDPDELLPVLARTTVGA